MQFIFKKTINIFSGSNLYNNFFVQPSPEQCLVSFCNKLLKNMLSGYCKIVSYNSKLTLCYQNVHLLPRVGPFIIRGRGRFGLECFLTRAKKDKMPLLNLKIGIFLAPFPGSYKCLQKFIEINMFKACRTTN